MKYDITYSCGHTGTVELYGKTSERESKIRWYETTAVCPECYKKQQQEAAAETTIKYELPELEGSEKQVAWAKKLMESAITVLETEGRKTAEEQAPTEAAKSQAHKAIDAHIARIRSAKHAADIIDTFKGINFSATNKSDILGKIFYAMDYNKVSPCKF